MKSIEELRDELDDYKKNRLFRSPAEITRSNDKINSLELSLDKLSTLAPRKKSEYSLVMVKRPYDPTLYTHTEEDAELGIIHQRPQVDFMSKGFKKPGPHIKLGRLEGSGFEIRRGQSPSYSNRDFYVIGPKDKVFANDEIKEELDGMDVDIGSFIDELRSKSVKRAQDNFGIVMKTYAKFLK